MMSLKCSCCCHKGIFSNSDHVSEKPVNIEDFKICQKKMSRKVQGKILSWKICFLSHFWEYTSV